MMRHCLVVMFVNAETTAYYTEWKSEPKEVFRKVTKDMGSDLIAWIGWSYFYRHTIDRTHIEKDLRELTETLLDNYRDRVTQRTVFKTKAPFKGPVKVLHDELGITKDENSRKVAYGFAYAQCRWKGAPPEPSDPTLASATAQVQ